MVDRKTQNYALFAFLLFFIAALAVPALGDGISAGNESITGYSPYIPSNQSVLYERGPEWDDYLNIGGSHTRKIYTGLMNYWNGTGYEPIDTTIVEENGVFKVEKGAYKVQWSNGKGFKFQKDSYYLSYQGKEISRGKSKKVIASIKEGEGKKDKNKIKFKEIYPSTDVEYIYYPDLLKENIILNKVPDLPADLKDTLDFSGYVEYSDGLEIWVNNTRQENNFSTSEAIEFRAGDEVEFTLLPPVIEDANSSRITGEYELVREDGKILLSVKVPYEWLINSSRVYPVIVDPSISIDTTADTFVNSLYPYNGRNFGRENYLEVQSYYFSNSRVLIGFPLTSSSPSGMMISSAKLWMYAYITDAGRTIDAWSVDNLWFEYSVTWNNQPPHVNKLSSNISGKGWRSWSVTYEALNKLGKYLFLKLMDREEDGLYKYQHYRSWDYDNETKLGYVPFLEVTYILQNDCDVGGDAFGTFNDANSISTPKTCSGYLDTSDRDDYYSFSVTSGSKIDVTMIPPYGADFDIYLYNPSGNEKAKSAQDKGYTEILSYVADSSGEWRIKVHQYSSAGTYSLNIITPIKQNDCGIGSDASNTFNGANLIPNQTSCSGYLDSSDRDDYYKFIVPSGYMINASVISPAGADFDLYLYDPNGNEKARSALGTGATDNISYTSDSHGEWRIKVRQYYDYGYYSFSLTVIDKVPPPAPDISSSTHPDENTWYSNKNPSFTWTAPPDDSGIEGYSYDLNQSSLTTPSGALKSVNSESYSSKADGIWYFHVRAKDKAGNWGAVAHYTVRIDATPPSVHISTPANNSIFNSSDILVSWSGSDSSSGVRYYEIRLDNGGLIPKNLETYHSFNGLGDGVHKVYVNATDNAGNQATSWVNFTIQSLPDLFISSEDITFEKVG